jgi:hypothetical protein
MSTANKEKINLPGSSNQLSQLVRVIVHPKVTNKPFYTIDDMESLAPGLRTVGAGLTQSNVSPALTPATDDFILSHQRFGVQYTVQAAGAQTISYPFTLDLSSNFFNAGFKPYQTIAYQVISGGATLTQAQRTVELSMIDTASTPVTFSSSTIVPEFRILLGSTETSVENLNDFKGVISSPMDKLSASTTKIFTPTLTFNLPVGTVFCLYAFETFRSFRDSGYLGNKAIVFNQPIAYNESQENTSKDVRGKAGNILGTIDGFENTSFSFEEETLNYQHYLALLPGYTEAGGDKWGYDQDLVIPTTAVASEFALSGVNNINNTDSKEDFVVTILDTSTGIYTEMFVVESGNQYLPAGTCKYVREGTKRLVFSASDAGKKIRVSVRYTNTSKIKLSRTALRQKVRADVDLIFSDSVNLSSATQTNEEFYLNCEIVASIIKAEAYSDTSNRIKLDVKQVITDGSQLTKSITF